MVHEILTTFGKLLLNNPSELLGFEVKKLTESEGFDSYELKVIIKEWKQ